MPGAPSNWSMFVNNTAKIIREGTKRAITMNIHPDTGPKTLWSFDGENSLHNYALGCDSDIGGTSTTNFTMGEDGKPRFWGDMRLAVKPELQGRIRGGYAGVRSRARKSLFGEIEDDIDLYHYLVLRLRIAGDRRTHNSYYCNIQTNSLIQADLFQHRLWFNKPFEWEHVVIPLNAFVLTNYGQVVNKSISLLDHRIRTVGISILGGNSGVEGKYELGIDSIKVVREEDLDVVPSNIDSGFRFENVNEGQER